MRHKLKIVSVTVAAAIFASGCGADHSGLPGLGPGAAGVPGTDSELIADGSFTEVTYKDPEVEEVPISFNGAYDDSYFPLCFFDGEELLPYISVADIPELMEAVYLVTSGDDDYELSFAADGNLAVLTRENGYSMSMDYAADTITFLDYDEFIISKLSNTLLDLLLCRQIDDPYGGETLFHQKENFYDRNGSVVTLYLQDYGIDLIRSEDDYYLPFQTVNDFLIAPLYVNAFYNGEELFFEDFDYLTNDDTFDDFQERYRSGSKGNMSRALADFNYGELCLMLDNLYGLKDVHGITRFDTMIEDAGLKERLISEDPNEVDEALSELIRLHLDDLHSSFVFTSHLSDNIDTDVPDGGSSTYFDETADLFFSKREEYFPDGVPGYQEVGNTAYITFDTFQTRKDVDFYEAELTADTDDTIILMLYAFSQITRPKSPVKNVVLDLSCNMGGDTLPAAFVLGMFMGTGTNSIRNTMTGALTTDYYQVDANRDHEFDEKDLLTDYNLYCLVSPVSFSCGNLVPCIFKSMNKVTLLGQTTGGGTCVVLPMSSAHGAFFSLSGPYQMSYEKNGSMYDIDRGTDPDYVITNRDHFYDRKALTRYINGLF